MSAILQHEPTTPEAYAADLYRRHHSAIHRFCARQLRRREDADDAVQTTFIYALLSLRRGVVPELEAPWLFTIARNVCSSRRRSGTRRSELESAQDLDSLQDFVPSPDRSSRATADELRTALDALPERQRKAMLLREWQGLSYHEIGDELGLSQQATETLIFRARRNLAERLDAAGVRGLNVAWLFSVARSFLRTGIVALGTAATVAVVPSAAEHAKPSQNVPLPAVVAAHDVGDAVVPAPPAQTRVRPSRQSRPKRIAPSPQQTAATETTAAAELPQTAPDTPASTPPTGTDTTTTPPPAQSVLPDVSETVPPLPAVELPEVTLPEVTVPEVQLPQVQLPTVTVPALPG